MTTRLFEIPVVLNKVHYVQALFDNGNAFYKLIDKFTARKLDLPRIPLQRKVGIISFDEYTNAQVKKVTYAFLDVGRHRQRKIYFYVIPKLIKKALILSRP
jgi:hypothetical protein